MAKKKSNSKQTVPSTPTEQARPTLVEGGTAPSNESHGKESRRVLRVLPFQPLRETPLSMPGLELIQQLESELLGSHPTDTAISTLKRLTEAMQSAMDHLVEVQATLERRVRQQEVVALLGRLSLSDTGLDHLFDEASRLIAETLNVEFSKILERKGSVLLLRAGVGWKPGAVGRAHLDCGAGSQAGMVIAGGRPVVVDNTGEETRFRIPSLFLEHGIVSGVNAAIGPRSAPWGVLGCHSARRVQFNDDDINFIESVAHVLYEAIETDRAQKALRSGEKRLRLTQEMGGIGSWDWDVGTNHLSGSPELFRILGIEARESFTLDESLNWVHPDDRASVRQDVGLSIALGQEFEREFRIIRGDGQVRWIACRGHLFTADREKPLRMLGVVQDVTEHKRTSQILERLVQERTKELRAANNLLTRGRSELRKLTSRLINVQEASFRRIARELHDRFSQDLAVLAIEVGGLEERVGALPEAGESLVRVRKNVETLAREINDVALQLHPSVLEDLGLPAAIRALCAAFRESSGIEVDCTHLAAPPKLSSEIGLAFYRIAQECFSNVQNHSGARYMEVSLESKPKQLIMTVRDAGCGFQPSQVKRTRGLGFVSMQERAHQIQGQLTIESVPGRGTTVILAASLPS